MVTWFTADTQEEIKINEITEKYDCLYLLQPNGASNIKEPNYKNDCVFGGVNVFEWVAQLNYDLVEMQVLPNDVSVLGAEILFCLQNKTKYPVKLSFNEDAVYEDLPESKIG